MHITNKIERTSHAGICRIGNSRFLPMAAFTLSSLLVSACNTSQQDTAQLSEQSEVKPSDSGVVQAEAVTADDATTSLPAYEVDLAHDAEIRRKIAATRQLTQQSALLSPATDSHEVAPFIQPSQENYAVFDDNKTVSTQDQPVSTFSIDVDTGSYANVRRFLQNGQLPPDDAVRIEEMLNYFTYDYPMQSKTRRATKEQPFSVTTELGPTPWNADTHLLHIGLQGYMPDELDEQSANLVFLIDVSGSMNSPEKLGLLKSAMSLMVQQLDEKDTVSIVVYAGASGVVLESTPGSEKTVIDRALAQLQAGGSTNGAQGIELAYDIAMKNYTDSGTNRLILATDGDFNVGLSDTQSLVEMIEDKRQSGIALTTLGLGMGNYNDHLMEQLADAGNGNYAYIDTLGEARKVLVDELAATLVTIAKDVKIQIEFNPANVTEYRLIGYTNRIMDNEDFANDRVDAGEIGAGHSVTALYEVALEGRDGERLTPRRYESGNDRNKGITGSAANSPDAPHANELAELRLRFKQPDSEKSQLISSVVTLDNVLDDLDATSNAYRFAASVAGFGQLLRGDTRVNDFGFDAARSLATEATQADPFGYHSEYLRLLDLAQSLDTLKRAQNTPAQQIRG